MATIDLGKIKLVNKNTWDTNATYTADDIVQYTDNGILSTYICVVSSSQGHTPSSSGTTHASWNFLAKGIADPIPTQTNHGGKALITDGSSLSWGSSKGSVINVYHFYKNGANQYSTNGSPQRVIESSTITPVSANSAFYVIGQICGASGNDGTTSMFQYSTNNGSSWTTGLISDPAGNRMRGHSGGYIMSDNDCMQSSVAMDYYDPNSTSNFKIALCVQGHSSGAINVNYDRNNNNDTHKNRGVSSFMVFEVDTTLTNNTQEDRG
mgnify:FL=1